MNETERLALPYILPGQAQKELFHNEALQRLDMIVQPIVDGAPANDPPASKKVGQNFLVGATPTADWAGHANALAAWTQAGWRFIKAFEGMEVSTPTGLKLRFDGAGWLKGELRADVLLVGGQKVVGDRVAAIADPAGGALVDQQCRSAVAAILAALRQHGLIAA